MVGDRSKILQLSQRLPRKLGQSGRHWACELLGVAVTQVEDFAAYEFAERFKLEVYRLIKESRGASTNQGYREQLEDAASGIEGAMSEGFGRRRPKEFALYLRYSLGSLNESRTRLRDGIHRGYFPEAACEQAFVWAERCKQATTELWRSQERKAAEEERAKSKKAKPKTVESRTEQKRPEARGKD
ncbi:MAG: four helix bundle protein [Acidobacteriota bacterium]